MKYYVIAERELVLGFKLVGVEGAIVTNSEEALEAFTKITGQEQGLSAPNVEERPKVLIITEDVAVMLEKEVLNWQKCGDYPLIVEIPGINGHIEGRKTMTDAIREAIGIHV